MENSTQTKKIKCPHCGRLTFYSTENPSRPFCSERCKLMDLGSWADEKYRVPTKEYVDYIDSEPDQEKDS